MNNKVADQTADAQAGLRLCCLKTTEDRFSFIEAQIMQCNINCMTNSVDSEEAK